MVGYNSDASRICVSGTTSDCILAKSFLSTRGYNYHWTSDAAYGSIGIVVHLKHTSGSRSGRWQAYFLRWNYWPNSGFGNRGFDVFTAISGDDLDQSHPAIDFDGSGNYLASWYQRQNTGSVNYKVKFAYLNNAGALDHIIGCSGCITSDISVYTKTYNGATPWSWEIGEYQDVWYTSYIGGALAATIDISDGTGDAAVYTVSP